MIYFSFDFCVGSEDESPVENLGQVLFGERIRPSPYEVWTILNIAVKFHWDEIEVMEMTLIIA